MNNSGPTQASSNSRNLNTFSVDSGVYFDRQLDAQGSVQTLEPRLFYLRVPFENQADLPVFDSGAFDFSISQLFRENRFSGADRIADADQISMALTSRIIDGEDGRELVRGSIGQIRYFKDRRVTLTENDGVETRDVSDVVGEVAAEINSQWSARGSIQYNPNDSQTVRGSILVGYRGPDDRIVNVAHRTVNTGNTAETEQLDFSFLWPLRDQWRLAGRWNYSLDANTSIESLVGVEYESCCWALRFAARRFIADDGLDHDTNVYLQLVLKGLAPVGQNYGALLENAILGYEDEHQR